MDRNLVRLGLQALPLIIPVNIYVIGDWLGTGVQWAFFRFQQTYMGTSIIPVTQDISLVLSGILHGKTGASLIVWGFGAALLFVALGIVLYAISVADDTRSLRYAPELTILAGILFLASCILQYGITLSSEAGFAIPVGVPLIIITGYWTYRMDRAEVPDEDEDTHSAEEYPEEE